MSTYSVDGIALDHAFGLWTLQQGTTRRPLPGARNVSVSVPGRAGELPIVGEDHDTTTLGLTLMVRGRTPAGAAGTEEDLERNMEALAAVFAPRHRLLDVRHRIGGLVRQADAKVDAVAEPELLAGANAMRVVVVLRIPGVYWRDLTAATWSGTLPGAGQAVTTLAGSTAPIVDAVARFKGPATNPSLTDVATGVTVSYTGSLTSGQWLLVDCGQLRAARMATDTWDLSAGTDVTGLVDSAGPGSASRWLHLTPAIAGVDALSRAVKVTATASGTTGASALQIRAKRSFL